MSSSRAEASPTGITRAHRGAHPEHERVWIVGGGSGHGFKHAPALAERIVAMLAGNDPPDPRLGLQARQPERKLRTAGAPK